MMPPIGTSALVSDLPRLEGGPGKNIGNYT